MPAIDAELNSPVAFSRIPPVKVVWISDRVLGIASAAPTPMSPRIRASTVADWATRTSNDPAAITASPTTRTRLRPSRSARLPVVSSRPPKVSE